MANSTARIPAIKSGHVEWSPAQAAAVLQRCNYDAQRYLIPRNVEGLYRQMKSGDWLENEQLTFCAGDPPVLVDGQHRLAAQVKADIRIRYQIRVLDRSPSEAYARIDTVAAKRQINAIMDASPEVFAALRGATSQYRYSAGRAFGVLARQLYGVTTVIPDDYYAVASDYVDTAKLVYDRLWSTSPDRLIIKPKLRGAGPLAVMLHTVSLREDDALAFWSDMILLNGTIASAVGSYIGRGYNATTRFPGAMLRGWIEHLSGRNRIKSQMKLSAGDTYEWEGFSLTVPKKATRSH